LALYLQHNASRSRHSRADPWMYTHYKIRHSLTDIDSPAATARHNAWSSKQADKQRDRQPDSGSASLFNFKQANKNSTN